MNSRVAIIILNWNGCEDTMECLDSVFKTEYPQYQVFLVDNRSRDNSVEMIRKVYGRDSALENTRELVEICYPEKYPENSKKLEKNDLILIKNDKNYGFTGGNNIGIEMARELMNPDYYLLLNNDTMVDPKFLNYLLEKGEQCPTSGFLGPKTYFYNDEEVIQAAGGGYIDFAHGNSARLGHGQRDRGQFDQEKEVDYIMGSCLLVKKEVIDKVGPLDSSFFMYWEDVDWCFRGRVEGYKSLYVPKAKIWHKEGTSSETGTKNYYHTRNRLFFVKRHASKGQYARFLSYFILYIGGERLYHYARRGELAMYHYLYRGFWDGIRGRMGEMK